MSRDFNGTADWLRAASAPGVTGMPLSIAAWFNPDNVTTSGFLVAVHLDNNDSYGLRASGATAGDPVTAIQVAGGVSASAVSSTGYTAGSWHHACAVFTSSTLRAAYRNGASKGTNATANAPAASTGVTVGGNGVPTTPTALFPGLIAEIGVWNVALSDAEVALLATGELPSFVRPDDLVAYWPLIGNTSPEVDLVDGVNLTISGSPAAAAHPTMIVRSTTHTMHYSFLRRAS